MMSTHFSFSFILYFVLCWYLLCKLFIIVPPLVHLSQPNHNQHHTTYVCRECIIRVVAAISRRNSIINQLLDCKNGTKEKKITLDMEYKKMLSVVTALFKSETHLWVEFHFSCTYLSKALIYKCSDYILTIDIISQDRYQFCKKF